MTLLLIAALILTIVALVNGGTKSPLAWAVLLIVIVLLVPHLPRAW